MNRHINPNRRTNPDAKFKEHIAVWHNFYKEHAKIDYQYSAKDFANLKFLLRKLDNEQITLSDYLNSIQSKWHLANMSIPLFNSHFNQLLRKESNSFPDHYSHKYEKTLEQHELAEYWKHLVQLGFKRSYSSGGGSTWIK